MNKKTRIGAFIFALILIISIPISASADTGPKPSVNLTFTGTEEVGEEFYVTLLSETKGQGPWCVSENGAIDEYYGIDTELWAKLSAVADKDDFYLLPYIQKCTDSFKWGYYPPSTFKVLIYSPEKDQFAISKIYERYAFDSYFTVDLSGFDSISFSAGQTPSAELTATKSYDRTGEVKGLIARMLITVFIEVLIALFFGYRGALTFLVLTVTNVITQLGLNLYLNYDIYLHGASLFYRLDNYLLIELLILVLEAAVYAFALPRTCKFTGRKRAVLYSAAANIISFALGIYLASVIPSLF